MKTFLSLALVFSCGLLVAQPSQKPVKERVLGMSIEVNASIDSVWTRFATASGRSKFFAPVSRMELSTLGFMEILFNPAAPEGQRGAENNRVLAFTEKEMI